MTRRGTTSRGGECATGRPPGRATRVPTDARVCPPRRRGRRGRRGTSRGRETPARRGGARARARGERRAARASSTPSARAAGKVPIREGGRGLEPAPRGRREREDARRNARRDRRPRLVTRRGTRAEDRARTPRDAPELAPERARRCERASPRAPKCGKVVAAVERAKRRQQSRVSRTRSHRRVRVLRDRDGPRAAAPAIGGWSFSPDRGRRVSARPRALFPRARFVPPRDARWPTRSTRRARRWTI